MLIVAKFYTMNFEGEKISLRDQTSVEHNEYFVSFVSSATGQVIISNFQLLQPKCAREPVFWDKTALKV